MEQAPKLPEPKDNKDLFENLIPTQFKALTDDQKAKLKGINAVMQFNIMGEGGGTWSMEIKDGAPTVTAGENPNAKFKIVANQKDWWDVVTQKVNAQQSFMSGKMKFLGDMSQVMKFMPVMQSVFGMGGKPGAGPT